MLARFYNMSFFQHIYFISMHNGRKPVCNQYDDMVRILRYVPYSFAYFFFGKRIKGRGGFIKYQQIRFTKQCPCYRKPLLLATRYFYAAFANNGINAFVGPCKQVLTG